jgi:hypothetical protein
MWDRCGSLGSPGTGTSAAVVLPSLHVSPVDVLHQRLHPSLIDLHYTKSKSKSRGSNRILAASRTAERASRSTSSNRRAVLTSFASHISSAKVGCSLLSTYRDSDVGSGTWRTPRKNDFGQTFNLPRCMASSTASQMLAFVRLCG